MSDQSPRTDPVTDMLARSMFERMSNLETTVREGFRELTQKIDRFNGVDHRISHLEDAVNKFEATKEEQQAMKVAFEAHRTRTNLIFGIIATLGTPVILWGLNNFANYLSK